MLLAACATVPKAPEALPSGAAVLQPTVVVRPTEIIAGHRSNCARDPEGVGRSDACAAVEGRWYGVERLPCRGPCSVDAIESLELRAWMNTAAEGFSRVAPAVVVSSGVVPDGAVATVIGNLGGAVGTEEDVWWAAVP
jgi:hypothetical protein